MGARTKVEGQDLLRGIRLLMSMRVLPRLVGRLMLDPRVPLRLKLILPAAIIYLISPWDVVPDMLPVLGRMDDVLVLVVSLAMFLSMAPKDTVADLMRKIGVGGGSGGPSRSDRTVIEGEYRVVDDGE